MNVVQKQKYCRSCKHKTLHQAVMKKQEFGCGLILGNLFLCVITLGLWLPIFILFIGLSVFTNALEPFNRKYLCQKCGRKN